MTTPYRNEDRIHSAYRGVLMIRTVGILMLAVIFIAAVFPQISPLAFSMSCLVLMVPALVYQIRLDNTLIFSGQALMEDGKNLYVVIGYFHFGYGRGHHMNKKIKSYRIFCIRNVKKIKVYPFGIAVKAVVQTASSKEFDIDEARLAAPGAMWDTLMRTGRKKTLLFRLERNLCPKDEANLLQRLTKLRDGEY